MNWREFFKPTKWKIIIFLIFMSSLVLIYFILMKYRILYYLFFPLKFFILDEILHFLRTIFIFMVRFCMSLTLAFFIFATFSYFISCLIVIGWNKFFEFFGERSKSYKIIVSITFIIIFFIFVILFPLIGKISIEKRFISAELNKERVFSGGDLRLQKLTIKNNLILPVKYKLPGVAVCVYDVEGKVAPIEYWTAYKSEEGDYISHAYQDTQNAFFVISLGAREKKKIYVSDRIGMRTLEPAMFEHYKSEVDELLFFETENIGNVKKYCQAITEEDRNKAERIKLVND